MLNIKSQLNNICFDHIQILEMVTHTMGVAVWERTVFFIIIIFCKSSW